ncbi:DNA/RNA helicase, superfamily II [Desulfosporosinus acidiphilus SJ4]|uniref:DNA/RNA helicase, superfamily II n=1 Tax=Desulfosporosinus acidiphilus (strain DSM 22704 / JCM 16185 / SJ4) TaxID=646529 RepID=I4D623_DESAJ|nr:DEAD/DEAH box helicase [Desulfosporosinus acidiphilus]AFM41247.1 DNA/RNA helicase, superfamily II [Desulfosporosinus acidiphilus SJ4]
MAASFAQLGLKEELILALKQQGINEPTAIQEQAIPLIIKNFDVVGQSQTGTGKTLAYLLPIFQKIDVLKNETQALILTPTHELALQIQGEIEMLAKNSGVLVTSAVIIGNVNIARQIEKLKGKQHIIVGSSGRVLELIRKRKISASTIKTIILDEADRLFDENNYKDVMAVLKTTLRDTQLVLFSATLPDSALKQAKNVLKNPKIVRISEKPKIAPGISHFYFVAEQRDKIEVLRKLIRLMNPTRSLIFINKSEDIETIVEKLKFHGLETEGIYGGASKVDRGKAMDDFKRGRIKLLVASDLAARGLDIKGVSHIFNLDLPEDPQLYLHRVGRTGRAGEDGVAVSLVTKYEISSLNKLERDYGVKIYPKEMAFGKIIDPAVKTKVKSNTSKNISPQRGKTNH